MITQDKILKLRKKISPDTHIIVEGKKDMIALKRFRFGRIITISGKSDVRLVETLRTMGVKRAAILTDFDKEGEKKYRTLSRALEKSGIKTDFTIRDRFKKSFKIREIEDMSRTGKLMDDYNNGDSHSAVGKTLRRRRFLTRKKHSMRRAARL